MPKYPTYLFEGQQRTMREIRAMLPAFVGENTVRRMLAYGCTKAADYIAFAEQYRYVSKLERGSNSSPWRAKGQPHKRQAAIQHAQRLQLIRKICTKTVNKGK